MNVSYELLKRRLITAKTTDDVEELGFQLEDKLQNVVNDEQFFERLFVWKNEQDFRIVAVYQGNDHWEVVAFYEEFLTQQKGFDGSVFLSNQEYHDEMNQTFHKLINQIENGEFQ